LILPDAVTLNRFFIPLCVFCLGTIPPSLSQKGDSSIIQMFLDDSSYLIRRSLTVQNRLFHLPRQINKPPGGGLEAGDYNSSLTLFASDRHKKTMSSDNP
jgi:hypothetical protein